MAEAFTVGRLLSIDWKLGVACASDTCRRLGAPYVTALVRIEDDTHAVTEHSVEMSIAQFQTFGRHIKDMSGIMETH
eukprot:m51a1_g286 hypothetical protein (77) ;mRNA; r:329624-330022